MGSEALGALSGLACGHSKALQGSVHGLRQSGPLCESMDSLWMNPMHSPACSTNIPERLGLPTPAIWRQGCRTHSGCPQAQCSAVPRAVPLIGPVPRLAGVARLQRTGTQTRAWAVSTIYDIGGMARAQEDLVYMTAQANQAWSNPMHGNGAYFGYNTDTHTHIYTHTRSARVPAAGPCARSRAGAGLR